MTSKVLVVDDSPFTQRTLRAILSNYDVCMTSNVTEAISAFEEWKPDVVLLDIGLPRANGLELLQYFKQIDDQVRVVMLTGQRDERTVRAAFLLGARDFVVKPFEATRVLYAVQQLLPPDEQLLAVGAASPADAPDPSPEED